jgi:hypothetical protein
MEFLKKHYEKIILSVVLLALVGVLLAMWVVIMADKQKMMDMQMQLVKGKPVLLPPLDMSRQDDVLARLKEPPAWDFSETNKLFNPVQWQKDGGKLKKIENSRTVGPYAVTIARIIPLYFVLRLDSVDTNTITPHYKISVEHQAAAAPAMRRPVPHYVAIGESVKNLFRLDKIQGPPEDPTELILVMPDGSTNVVKKAEPFRSVEGYAADLRYDPENLKKDNQRVGDHLIFANEDHNIVAIDQNEVVLLAQSNQKKYVLPYRQ